MAKRVNAIKEFFAKKLVDQQKTIDQVIDEVNKRYNLEPDKLVEIGKQKTDRRVKNQYYLLAKLRRQEKIDGFTNEVLDNIWETKYYLASLEEEV